MKVCSVCKKELSLGDFYKQKDGAQGVASRCKTCLLSANKEWAKQNPNSLLKATKKYRNTHREIMLERTRTWRKSNLEYDKYRSSLRRHTKKKATPSWADKEKIKSIYLNCAKGYHVDHIIPIKGKNVSGLHNEFNLQYLTAQENHRKGNRYGEG